MSKDSCEKRLHPKSFAFLVCGKQLSTRDGLSRHMNKHTDNFKHRCTLCEKGFNRPYELKRHMNQKHGAGKDKEKEKEKEKTANK